MKQLKEINYNRIFYWYKTIAMDYTENNTKNTAKNKNV